MIISRRFLPGRRKDAVENCRENLHTHFVSTLFVFENRVIYEIITKNTAEPDGP